MSDAGTQSRFSGRTAWARSLQAPLRDFLATEIGSAAVLLAAAVAALAWANIDLHSYESVWHTDLSIEIGSSGISQDLRDWVNSGLMTFFFFVVGLEVRREFDVGELRERRRLALPVLAALGGMVVPIAIYLAFNAGDDSAQGWGVAMSTDTAFALGMLALVGPRFPDRLRGFLLTIIVVDDVVALLVIASAYSGTIDVMPLLIAAGHLRRFSSASGSPASAPGPSTSLLGVAAWVALYESGVDPVVVGLVIGLVAWANPAGRARARAGDRAVPRLPRAADPRTRAVGAVGAAGGDLAERAPAAALPPVDELRDRAALRARQHRDRDRRRLPLERLHLADHARDPGRLRARQAGRDRSASPGW